MKLQKSKFFWEIKKIWKFFVVLFLISFCVFNWGKFSWLFNYHFWRGFLSGFQSEEKNIPTAGFISVTENPPLLEVREFEYSEKENSLEIPAIEIRAPIFLEKSSSEKEAILKSLDSGLVLFSDSALPGKTGQTIIIGHSARHNWPKTNYTWVFTYLKDVKIGDEIFLYFNHKKYPYLVKNIFYIEKGGEIPASDLTKSENMLILMSCWPPGRDKQRIIVEAALQ